MIGNLFFFKGKIGYDPVLPYGNVELKKNAISAN